MIQVATVARPRAETGQDKGPVGEVAVGKSRRHMLMWAKPREIARASGLIFYNSLLEVQSEAGQSTGVVRKIITPPILIKKI